jgi:hypothetical protein
VLSRRSDCALRSQGALSFSRPRLASGITGIAGRLALGFQGDVIGGSPGDLGTAGSLLGCRCSIAGGLLVGLAGNAGQPGSGSARIASDADSLSGGLSSGECRIVCPGSRTKLLQLRLLRERPRGYRIDLDHMSA